MRNLVLDTEPLAVQVTFTDDKLIIHLADGRSIVVPLAWYPRLLHGSPERVARVVIARRQLCYRVVRS